MGISLIMQILHLELYISLILPIGYLIFAFLETIGEIEEKKVQKSNVFFFICILAIGIIIRFQRLGNPDLWIDEILTSNAVSSIWKSGYPALKSGVFYGRGVFYSYLTSLPIKIWETHHLLLRDYISYEFALRFISAAAGVLTIYVIYAIGNKLFDKTTGLVSALIISSFYWQIEFSRYARMYQLFQLLYLITIYFFLQAYILNSKNTMKYKILWALSFMLSIFTHQLAITLIPLFLIALIKKRREFLKSNINFVLLGVIFIAFYTRFIIFDQILLANFLNSVGDQAIHLRSIQFNQSFLFFFLREFPIFSAIGLSASIYSIINQKKAWRIGILIFIFIQGNFFVDLLVPKRQTRYVFFLFPVFVLVATYGLSYIAKAISSALAKKMTFKHTYICLVIIILVYSFLPLKAYLNPFVFLYRKENINISAYNHYLPSTVFYQYPSYSEYSEFLNKNYKKNDILVSTNPLFIDFYSNDEINSMYWLRQKDVANYSKFNDEDKLISIYDNTYFVDSVVELKSLRNTSEETIWLVIDSTMHLSDSVKEYLKSQDKNIVYVGYEYPEGIYKFNSSEPQ
jgi:uncharacterized membrane protein